MSLPPVGGPPPEPGLPGLPEDDSWLESDWLESDWLEAERTMDREEPPEEELPGAPPFGFAAGGLLDSMVPGASLAEFAAEAFDGGLAGLSDDELVGALLAARRLSSWQAALELAAVSELDARRRRQASRPESSRAGEHVSEELAAALVLTGKGADMLLSLSRELDRLPTVLKSLRSGRIDRARAVVFAEELVLLTGVQARAIAMALIRPAEKMTTSQLRAAIRALILAAIPGSKEERDRRRAERARRDARVEVWAESSGNAAIAGRELPAGDAIAADQRLTAIAQKLKDAGVPGNLDQLRAVAYITLLTGRDLDALIPGSDAGGDGLVSLSGSVNLTMPLATWLGSSDAPGEADGYGPLAGYDCRDLAGELAASGKKVRWCITLTDPAGRAVAHGCARASPSLKPGAVQAWLGKIKLSGIECGTCAHERQTRAYRPPEMMRHLVNVRQRTCAFPGCRRPARRCDLDHTISYDEGGRTCPCNLSPLCRRHHQAKQAPGWQLQQPRPGTLVWTTPHGRSYIREPDPYPV